MKTAEALPRPFCNSHKASAYILDEVTLVQSFQERQEKNLSSVRLLVERDWVGEGGNRFIKCQVLWKFKGTVPYAHCIILENYPSRISENEK